MTHGNVRKWAKREGEPLEQYELLFDLDTDSLTEDAYKVGDFEGRLLAMGSRCQVQLLPCVWQKQTVLMAPSCMLMGTSESFLWAHSWWCILGTTFTTLCLAAMIKLLCCKLPVSCMQARRPCRLSA